MDELRELPGVGRKTANVVLGNAFGKNEGIVVDTHVIRLSQRLGLTKQKDPEKIERDLMKLVPQGALDELESLAHLARASPLFRAQTGLLELRDFSTLSQRENIYSNRCGARSAKRTG